MRQRRAGQAVFRGRASPAMALTTPDFSAVRVLLVVAIKTAPFAGNNQQESKALPQPWPWPGR